jgi:hypothetical protein
MRQEELVNKLKLRERSILLVELSRQVNDLRRALIKEGNIKKLPIPFASSKSASELPQISPTKTNDAPHQHSTTHSSESTSLSLRGANSTVSEVLGSRPATVSDRSLLNSPTKSKIKLLHNKPFSAPLYHVVEEPFVIGELGHMSEKPIVKQTNFLRARHSEMFAASAGAQAEVMPHEIEKKMKKFLTSSELLTDSFYSMEDSDLLIEDAGMTFSWLGLDKSRHAEIIDLRKQLVRTITEAAKLKKKHVMATSKAASLQGKGREIKLKANARSLLS